MGKFKNVIMLLNEQKKSIDEKTALIKLASKKIGAGNIVDKQIEVFTKELDEAIKVLKEY